MFYGLSLCKELKFCDSLYDDFGRFGDFYSHGCYVKLQALLQAQ